MRSILLVSLTGFVLPLHVLAAQTAPDPFRAVSILDPAVIAPIGEDPAALATLSTRFSQSSQGRLSFDVSPGRMGTQLSPAQLSIQLAPSTPRLGPLQVLPTADQDFLFGPPAVSIGIRGGMSLPRARSDIFALVTDTLTADRSDFFSAALSLELAIRLSSRIDVVLGVGRAAASARTEYRNWVDLNDRPIEQTTRLQRVPVTAGAKVYLTPRGRQVGEFAWIPAKVAFYVAGGGGLMHYRFEQEGDFVDFVDLSIFEGATYESSGWGGTAYVALGGDLRLTPATFLSLEARGGWAAAELGRDFVGFDPIDLSGLQITLGLHRSL